MLSDELKQRLLQFRAERNWEQFHTPKDLAVSIVLEAAELLENFQWKDNKQIEEMLQARKDRVSEEIADIVIYLSYLVHDLEIDLNEAVGKKIQKNGKKYPVERSRGSARKYNEF